MVSIALVNARQFIMKKFLFITHITPVAKRTVLRQGLIDCYFKALEAQRYGDWQVVIMGEENKEDGKFHYFDLGKVSREEKFHVVKSILQSERFQKIVRGIDYVIKLDDDDIISPTILEKVSTLDADIYFDKFHSFYEITSGMITQQERNWMASTCIHRKECIFSEWNGVGASAVGNLLYTEHHLAWHEYYKNKRKVIADRNDPVYLRVLSPTSITSGALAGPPANIGEINFEKYISYLKNFGDWSTAQLFTFQFMLPELSHVWKQFAGKEQKKWSLELFYQEKSFGSKIKKFFKREK